MSQNPEEQKASLEAIAAELDRLVTLARRADLPATPRLYLIASPTLNAFAVGKPDDAAKAVRAANKMREVLR